MVVLSLINGAGDEAAAAGAGGEEAAADGEEAGAGGEEEAAGGEEEEETRVREGQPLQWTLEFILKKSVINFIHCRCAPQRGPRHRRWKPQ